MSKLTKVEKIEVMTVGDLLDCLRMYPRNIDVELIIDNSNSPKGTKIMATYIECSDITEIAEIHGSIGEYVKD